MLITTAEFFILLIVITSAIYMCYKSRMQLLADEAFAEKSKLEVRQAVSSIKVGVEEFKIINERFEKYNKEQKNANLEYCFLDESKVCDFCKDSCPFRSKTEGGDVK